MAADREIVLTALLDRLPAAKVTGDCAQLVTAIEFDSRTVSPGALFVALRGSHTDGHRYAAQAIERGASAIVVEESARVADYADATVIRVEDSKRALSVLSAAFYGDPSRDLDVIGVTGTNGKTTTTRMIAAILNAVGRACGVIGTVGAELGSRRWTLGNTTPLPPELHAVLAAMRDDGARAVAIEVSSHALALERVEDVFFRAAALTNVTRDHLDFHESAEAYAAAKRHLFELTQACVLNVDDARGRQWALELGREGRRVVTYGNAFPADIAARDIVLEPSGSRFTVNGQAYELHLPGRFNIWNALAAIGIVQLLEIGDAAIARGLATLHRVPGRMERLGGMGVDVVVDYAHTPDALENALRALRETSAGAIALVFGCGGDRDRGKRAEMGAVAARLADRLYLTSDNPRSEEPRAIVDDMLGGIPNGVRHVVELDRRLAIERAITEARAGDVVLVAGKGHEAYQIVGDTTLPFDDAAVAREALALLGTPR
ncbi:MAG TPA: UDP-N-acetylmuramoyl-L-alanyl-D-glutamate--2,6-diaminopimelate ligase [Candidatus Cybelea sp.]|nr:UDP-N-acetylmuramoyl-L-alanyl-D-glutamate--2,6-diaminopimelate ligase [Candidatus Cybelea sp.]